MPVCSLPLEAHSQRSDVDGHQSQTKSWSSCVITHGPNPKTKHIYGDFILEEDHSLDIPVTNKPEESGGVAQAGCNSFGMVILGEKAFCSPGCRWQEIMIDEEVEKKTVNSRPSSGSASCDTFFFPSLAVAT
ncbi:hypothetical protein EJ110_NYTH14508 [Nymphaea thermarum]|nr:hypothetical protein EJ110_NYTH14508 [Nymphaea thermarum]